MREVALTKNSVALVDDDDFERINKYSWRFHNGYAARTTSRSAGRRTTILMHREILGEVPENMDVDHINGNKSDNRKSNLRVVTRKQNMHNAPKKANNTTGYKGVHFDSRRGKYRARFKLDGKDCWLGYFENPHDAARMYNFWSKDLFGEYARLNVIKEEAS